MLIRFEQGKGAKDQYVMLSPRLLAVLRDHGQGRAAGCFPARARTGTSTRASLQPPIALPVPRPVLQAAS
jgi:hypothetical protein